MFDVSFTELLVIGVVALVVIGPERLPKVARTIGHLVGRAQRYVNDVKSDIQREVELDDLRKLKDQMQDAAQSVRSTLSDTEASFRKPLETIQQDTMSALKSGTAADAAGVESAPVLPAGESTAISEGGAEFAQAEQVAAGSEVAPGPAAPRASVTATDSPSASAHVAAASPTPPAGLTSNSETPGTPQQLELTGVVTDTIPEPLPHPARAPADATAPAAAATPKPGTPT